MEDNTVCVPKDEKTQKTFNGNYKRYASQYIPTTLLGQIVLFRTHLFTVPNIRRIAWDLRYTPARSSLKTLVSGDSSE